MDISWDDHADVVIISIGAAGLSAAIEARQAGASAKVFEKMPLIGGNTRNKDTLLLEIPPFYAIRLWPKIHYTPGGLLVDTRARVMDLFQHPIPGLFTAGEVTGGIHGAGRLVGRMRPDRMSRVRPHCRPECRNRSRQ